MGWLIDTFKSILQSSNETKSKSISIKDMDISGYHLSYDERVWVQKKLKAIGLYQSKLYRDFVPTLVEAVRDFQRIKGLYVDGVVGPQTWEALVKQPVGPIIIEKEVPSSTSDWYNFALKYIGLTEIVGPEHNRTILEMFKVSGHPDVVDDETAWCSAFMNFIMIKTGHKGTLSLLAQSWRKWGKQINKIEKGAVVIVKRGTVSWQGHVTLATGRVKPGYFEGLGGNQNNAVNKRWYKTNDIFPDGIRWAA